MKKGGEDVSIVTHRPPNSRKGWPPEQCGLSVNWPCGRSERRRIQRCSSDLARFDIEVYTMEGIILDVSALRRDYRDSITQLSNTAVHRKNVDNDMLAESCYFCLRGLEIGEGVTTNPL
jgi:hypothetical protein